MKQVVTWGFEDNFIDNLADYIYHNFYLKDTDLSRIACIFGGRRPALFLRRALSQRIKKSFISPVLFSIDDFVFYCLRGCGANSLIDNLDASFLIYNLAKKSMPDILKSNKSFAEFLPWSQEIVSFIEQLDLECVSDDALRRVQASAAIGYEVPDNINKLLIGITKLRKNYHAKLHSQNKFSRGLMYGYLGKNIKNIALSEFDKIMFCNFFYLHKTESLMIKELISKGKAICFFQGSGGNWPVLAKTAADLGVNIETDTGSKSRYRLNLYQGFDTHSQASLVRHILDEKCVDKDNTVVVLPQARALLPVLGEILNVVNECNVSMGYPLNRNPLYVLFDLLAKVNESAKGNQLYARDYLDLMRHPLVKNINIDGVIMRVMVHKIEEFLSGILESPLGGRIFLSLNDIESEDRIYDFSARTLLSMGITIDSRRCKKHLLKVHDVLLGTWPDVKDFYFFSQRVKAIIDLLGTSSALLNFPFNVNAVHKILNIIDKFGECSFAKEHFRLQQIWDIFRRKLQAEVVPFRGSPLSGTQILGLLETRSLNFKNVIIMDMNESVLPKLQISEPLIPREVMLSLGINRLEKEEEIQRYQFRRLIESAKNVHLVYAQNEVNEKSRFIEELLWQKQKQSKMLEVADITRAKFKVNMQIRENIISKTPQMVEFLKNQTYSASRLNTYISCPLQFYFKYVLGLKERDDLLEAPEAKHIGTFIHELLEETFSLFLGKRPVIDRKFCNYFFKRMEEEFSRKVANRMRSDSILLKGIIKARLNKFLEYEQSRAVANIICLEDNRKGSMDFKGRSVSFAYTVDRVDELDDGSIVVIDYKTGGSNIAPKSLKFLKNIEMSRASVKENIRSLQMPIYYYFIEKEYPKKDINAVLYNIRDLNEKYFITKDDYPFKDDVNNICFKALSFIFEEIFDESVNFEPDKDEQRCQYCSFSGMCT